MHNTTDLCLRRARAEEEQTKENQQKHKAKQNKPTKQCLETLGLHLIGIGIRLARSPQTLFVWFICVCPYVFVLLLILFGFT